MLATSDFETPILTAITRTEAPPACMARIFCRSTMMRLRPNTLPSRLARLRPATTRSDSRAMLSLGYRRQNGNHGISEHARTVKVLLRETLPCYTVTIQPLQVLERLEFAFTAEPIKRAK